MLLWFNIRKLCATKARKINIIAKHAKLQVFLLCAFGMSSWLSKYLQEIHIEDIKKVNKMFAFDSVTFLPYICRGTHTHTPTHHTLFEV